MIPLLAALLLAGAAGAGPVLVSDACGNDTTTDARETATSRCTVDNISRSMKAKTKPAELKVEAEGKLYSVPEGVEMITPTPQARMGSWWEEVVRKVKEFVGRDSSKAKAASSPDLSGTALDEAAGEDVSSPSDMDSGSAAPALEKDVPSAGEHSCQICFEHNHSTVMLPCGHGGLCWECGLQIYALTQECPMCRRNIDLLVQVDGKKRRFEGADEFVSAVCA